MVTRKEETADIGKLVLGSLYSRPEIATTVGVSPLVSTREWLGYVEFTNAILIFVKLDKSDAPAEHKYDDYFDGSTLFWDSRDSHSQESSQVQQLIQGDKPVFLFARVQAKVRSLTQPFAYCGRLQAADYFGNKPVHFQWHLLDYPGGLAGNETLDALAVWRKSRLPSLPSAGQPKPSDGRAHVEGARIQATANRYERDTRARAICLDHHGYKCSVCSFDFEETYGDIGREFIFVHHVFPVATRARAGSYRLDPVEDLIPICGNCHVVVHRSREASINGTVSEEAKQKLEKLRSRAQYAAWEAAPE